MPFFLFADNLYLLCNPCDADLQSLKLSAYLRLLNIKRKTFLEDDRNKFAEEAPWYLGKRSGGMSGNYGLIDYPMGWSWRARGKRMTDDFSDTAGVESIIADDSPPPYFAMVNGNGRVPAWMLRQPRSATQWKNLMYQTW